MKCWAVVFPDGEIHPAWMYQTRALLKETAPGEITGQCASWAELVKRGYRIARTEVTVLRKTK